MSLWRHFTRGLRTLARPAAADDDLADELQQFVDAAASDFIAQGVPPEEARRRAQRELGNAVAVRDQVRSYGWENVMSDFFGDLRYALRQLRNHAGFSFTAILILALGIGASTAIFSAVNPILFKALPYPHAERLTTIFEMKGGGSRLVSFGFFYGMKNFNAEKGGSGPFEALAVYRAWQPAVMGLGQPERLEGQRVSAEYFRVLGAIPVLGRDFQAADDVHHGPNLVILSDRLWRRRFNSDPAIIGRKINLENDSSQLSAGGDVFTVIGVMPAGFENVLAPEAEIWSPLQYDAALPPRSAVWGHHLQTIGRLREGFTRKAATSELEVFLPTLKKMYAKGFAEAGGPAEGVIIDSMQNSLTAGVRPGLLAVLGAVVLVLIIACVNVTNLLLARGAQRRGEFAMRASLGAEPRRLVRQLLTESLLLALIAGVCALAIAQAGVKAIVALGPAGLPRLDAIRLDSAVFLFALIVTSVVGLVVGVMPAFNASHSDPHTGLQQNSRTSSHSHQFTRRTLVVSEVGLALVLLVSAGLLLRSLERLFSIDPGFDASHLLTMQVQESGDRYVSDAARARFFKESLQAASQLPGVLSAAFTNQLPLSGDYEVYGMEFEAFPNDDEPAFRYAVTPEYIQTMRIPLRRGRLLDENDRAGAPVAVLISESLAKRKFAGKDPAGQRVRMGPGMHQSNAPWATIVGVVGDVKQLSLATNEPDAFYTTPEQWAWVDNVETLILRTRGDASALAPAARAAIWSIDKDQPIVRVATMQSLVTTSEAERRFALMLFETFAIVGLILAATGIYGVLAGSVTERTREIGVRSALGASRGSILSLILQQGLTLAGMGIAIGVVGALAASQALRSLMFGISRLDPVTYLAVIGLLFVVSALACWLPAWRAARVDPVVALRAE
ncbi:MAG: ABC transporter permease [Acidobacteria bacterium]|nr:ABC transporter permease [Acidobacteriota bacterium]